MQNNFFDNQTFDQNELLGFFDFLSHKGKKLCVTGDLIEFYKEYNSAMENEGGSLTGLIEKIQESIAVSKFIYLDIREKIANINFYRVNLEEGLIEEISISHYLISKEAFAYPEQKNNLLTLNFDPFYQKAPNIRDTKYIGTGVDYLNRYLSSQMFYETDKWKKLLFEFLQLHKYNSDQLMINDRIHAAGDLDEKINKALKKLEDFPADTLYEEIKHLLQEIGFEKGLGRTVGDITATLELLDHLLNRPDHDALMKFIGSVPMIFNVAIISVHGFFAQDDVLGLPDTGGQVVYILDQVKALEKSMIELQKKAGLDVNPKIIVLTRLIPDSKGTTCSNRLEKIHGTKNAWILRVPFREHNRKVTEKWISRFEIWPYLEEFTEDAYVSLMAEFGGRPDLIIGNYSDGNLVSYLLSKRFKVTQCCIAHALEKSKYLFSALYWKDLEQYYNFSLQFTADLIAINSADFLITSSFQEIAGTEESIGQYESYKHFTMPGLYRVENGVNPFHTKFNILSPGIDEKIFFPYTRLEKRIGEVKNTLTELLFENIRDNDVVGEFANPNLIPLFTMARLDKIKNLTSLVRWFGRSGELRELCNLIVVAGKTDPSKTSDIEEQEQIHLMHNLINEYNLHSNIRWIGKLFRKDQTGEIYRIIADRKGVFIQPALFEGFGLTVLEAMVSGLPVFATKYGGPLEIIQNKVNGFHIDPVNERETTDKILKAIKEFNSDPKAWDKISKNAVKRVNEKYNWKLYTTRLLSLAKIYGFWKYTSKFDRKAMEAYLDIIYHTVYRPRAASLLERHNKI